MTLRALKPFSLPEPEPPARRSRPGGRSARIVADVLRMAADELARTGYEAFRVEDVAERAGVNKTTIYRRWPTKADLVSATVRHLAAGLTEVPDTGALRQDFLEAMRTLTAHARAPESRGLARILLTQIEHPEVARMARMLRQEHRARWGEAVRRAVARGELPQGTSPPLVAELVTAAVTGRLFRSDEPVDEAFCMQVVDVVIAGARAGAAITEPPRSAVRPAAARAPTTRTAAAHSKSARAHRGGPRRTER